MLHLLGINHANDTAIQLELSLQAIGRRRGITLWMNYRSRVRVHGDPWPLPGYCSLDARDTIQHRSNVYLIP